LFITRPPAYPRNQRGHTGAHSPNRKDVERATNRTAENEGPQLTQLNRSTSAALINR